MNEEYLKKLHAHLNIKDDYNTWISAVKDNEEYLRGLHGHIGVTDTFENWNRDIFGVEKKKDDSLVVDDGTSDLDDGDGESQEIVDPNIESEETEEKEVSIFETPEYTGEYEINGIPTSKEELLILLEIPGYIEKIKKGEEVITTDDPEILKKLDEILGESEDIIQDDEEYIPQTQEGEGEDDSDKEEEPEIEEEEEPEEEEEYDPQTIETDEEREIREQKEEERLELERKEKQEKIEALYEEAESIGAQIHDGLSIEEMEAEIERRKKEIKEEEERIEQEKENNKIIENSALTQEYELYDIDPNLSEQEKRKQLEEKKKEVYYVPGGSTYELNYIENKKHNEIKEKYGDNFDTTRATIDPEDVYNYLIDNEREDENGNIIGHNFTDAQARAIINNMMEESMFEAGAIQRQNVYDKKGRVVEVIEKLPREEAEKTGNDTGIGLFQFTWPSRKLGFLEYFNERDLDWRDPDNWKHQIDYMITEDETDKFITRTEGWDDIDEITEDFMIYWENPADKSSDAIQKRKNHKNIYKDVFRRGGIVRKYQEGGYTPQTQEVPQDTIPQTTQDNVPVPDSGQQTDGEYKPQSVAMQPWDYMTDIDATNYRRLLAEGKTSEANTILDKYPKAKNIKIKSSQNKSDGTPVESLEEKILGYDLIKNEILFNNPNADGSSPENLQNHALTMLDNVPWQYYKGGGTGFNPAKVWGDDYQNNPNYIETMKREELAKTKNMQIGDQYIAISDDEIITKKELIKMIEEDPDIMDNIDYLNIPGEEELPDYITNNPEFAKIYSRRYDFPFLGEEINSKLTGSYSSSGEFIGGVRISDVKLRKKYSEALSRGWAYIGKDAAGGKMQYLYTPSGAILTEGEDGVNPLLANDGMDAELIELFHKNPDALTEDFLEGNNNYRLETLEESKSKEDLNIKNQELQQTQVVTTWDLNTENEFNSLYKINKLRQEEGLPPIITEELSEILNHEIDGYNVVLNKNGELSDLDGNFDESKTFWKGDEEFKNYLSQGSYDFTVTHVDNPMDSGTLYREGVATRKYITKQEEEAPEQFDGDYGVSATDPSFNPLQKVVSKDEADQLAVGSYMMEKFIATLPRDSKGNITDMDYIRWKYFSGDPTVLAFDSGVGLGGMTEEKQQIQGSMYRTNLETRAYEYFAGSMNNALNSMDKILEKTGIMKEAETLGEQIIVADDWINKQIDMLSKFPTKLDSDGMMIPDTENMTDMQIEDYNKLVTQIQSFNEDIYVPLLKQRGDFHERDIIKQYSGIMETYNAGSQWRSKLMDRNMLWGNFMKGVEKTQIEWDKAYSDGKLWGALRWVESMERDIGNIFADTPNWIKGVFTNDAEYDWTDAMSDTWQFSKDYESLIMTPSVLKLGTEFQFVNITSDSEEGRTTPDGIHKNDFGKDFKIVLSEDGVTPIQVMTSDDVLVPMSSPIAQHLIQKFQTNPNEYNIELDENNYAWWNSLGQSGMGLASDILLAGRVSAFGKTTRAKNWLFKGTMMGSYNVKQYGEFRRAYLDEIGGNLAEADDYARAQTMIVSLTQLINPNIGFGKGFSTWLDPKKYTTAWKNLSLVSGRRALFNSFKYNTSVIARNAGTEGLQEVSELEVARLINAGYNYTQDGRDFDLTRNWNEYKDSFTVGAALGGASGSTEMRFKGFKNRLQQEALFYGYQNQETFFNSLDNLVGTKNFYWEGNTIELTKEKAAEIKDKFKNLFQQTDNLIATSDKDLKDGQKLHIMNLLEHKQHLEAFQGHKDPKIQKRVKDTIADIDGKLERLLNGESVADVMTEPSEFGDLGVNPENMSPASKNVIRHRNNGKEWGTEGHKNTVRGLKLEIDRLEKIENKTREESRLLSLHKELLNEVQQIKPTINEETDPDLEKHIKNTIREESGKSAPGIESEAKRAPKDSEVKSIREADGTTSKQITPINDRSKIKDVIGKNITYKGKQGILQRDSDGNIVIKTPKGDFVIRNKKGIATQNQILKTHGIKAKGSSFTINPEGKISVNNNPKQDVVGMIKNEDGDLESMVVTDPNLTDRQSKIAKNKFKKLKNKLDNGEITQSEFNNEVSNIKGVNLLNDPDILTDVATENLINEMLSKKDTSVIDMAEVDAIIEEESQIEAEKEAQENYKKEAEEKGKKINKKQINKKGTRYKNNKEDRKDLKKRAATHKAAGGAANRRKATVLKMIDKILGPLGLDVIVHNDSDSMYNDLRKSGMTRQDAYAKMNSKGFILMDNGEIHINLDRASGNTVFHEAAHPFVQIIKKAKQAEKGKGPVTKLWNDISKTLETQKRPNRDTTYMEFGVMSVRNEDGSYNTDDAVEEALSEYLGDAGLDQFKNDQTALNKAKEFAKKILEFFGVNVNKNPLKISIEDMSNIEDVKNRFQSTIPKGKEINIDEEYRSETEVEPEVEPGPKTEVKKTGKDSNMFPYIDPVTEKEINKEDLINLDDFQLVREIKKDKKGKLYRRIKGLEDAGRPDMSKYVPEGGMYYYDSIGVLREVGKEYGDMPGLSATNSLFEDVKGTDAKKGSPKFQIDETNHSNALDAVKHSTIGRGTPKQWMNNLKMVGDENIVEDLKFLGMNNFLESAERLYADDLIPKEALEDYITLNKTKVEKISNSEIKISNPLYDLGNVRYTKKIDEDGNSIMLVEDVIAPDNEMSSNIEPIVRRLVRYSSDLGFDGLAFKPGQNFDGPKQTFFNETIPDVIRDVTSSIDKSAGPTVTNINGEAHNSIDITNKVKAASTRINLPSFQVDEGIDPDMEYVHQMYNGKVSFATDFIQKWLTPSGPGGFDAYNRQREMLGRRKAKIEAVKAAQETLQKAIDNNDTFTLEQVNDALTDPATLIASLKNEISILQSQIDNLSKGMTDEQVSSFNPLRTRQSKINEINSRIKELRDNHRGKTKVKNLESDPELADAVRNAREMIDALSQSLINQGVVQGELAGTVLANKSIYLMKQYRAHHDMDYVKKQMNAIEMAKEAGEGEFYNSATTIGRVTTFVRNQLQEKYNRELEQYNNGQIDTKPKKVTMNMVQQEVLEVFRSGNNSTVYNRAVHINKPSNKIFKKRKDMPEEIVEFLGEIENPSWNFAHTAEQMINSIELTTYRNDVVKTLMAAGNGKFIIEGIPTTPDLQKKLTETIEVDGKTYSVTKDIHAQIEGAQRNTNTALKFYMKFLGYTKLGLTVYNPVTHVRNFTANVGFAVMNGHINFSTLKNTTDAWSIATNIFRKSSNAKQSALWESMIEEGMIDETVGLEEIKDLLRSDGGERSFFESINKTANKSVLGKIQRGVEGAYRFEDVVWKVTGFLQEMQTAEKAGMSRQDAIKRAGYVIRNTYPNYSAVPLLAKKLRVNPLVGSFVSFPAEVIRTSMMTVKIAKDELASGNPVLVKRGAARMTGTIINLIAMPTLTKLAVSGIMALMGFDDEENYSLDKQIAESLKFIGAPWNEFGTIIPISNPEGGVWYSWNIHDNLSHGFLYDIANSIFDPPKDDPTKDRNFIMSLLGGSPVLSAIFDPFLGTDVLAGAVEEALTGVDSNGQRIFPENTSTINKVYSMFGHIINEVRPGVVKTIGRFFDPDASLKHEIIGTFAGIRFGKTDVGQAAYYRTKDVINNIKGLDPKYEGDAELVKEELIRNLKYLEKMYHHAKLLGIEKQMIKMFDRPGLYTTPVEDDPNTPLDETMLEFEASRTTMENARLSQAIIDILERRDKSIPIEQLDWDIWIEGTLSERQLQEYNELLEK